MVYRIRSSQREYWGRIRLHEGVLGKHQNPTNETVELT